MSEQQKGRGSSAARAKRAASSNGVSSEGARRSSAPKGAGANGANGAAGAAVAAGSAAAAAAQNGAGVVGRLAKLGAQAGYVLAGQLRERIPTADLDERDPDYIREQLPGLWMLASFYFRAEVRNLERIPASGPVLLVGNHSGGNLTPDTHAFTLAFLTHFGVERRFYQLAHNLVLTMPGLSRLRKFGTVAASHENAEKALDTGAALLVYPGGDYEVHRPSWDQAQVGFDNRKGFIRLALRKDVPIVPVVSIGGQETALFLSRGERLAKLLRLDKTFRLKVLPISLALPWGLNIGDMLGHIPLPAKLTVQVLEPIDLKKEYGPDPDLQEVYDDIVGRMQIMLDALADERRFPLIG